MSSEGEEACQREIDKTVPLRRPSILLPVSSTAIKKRNDRHEQQTCLLVEHFRQETPPPMVNRDGKKVAGKPDFSEVRKKGMKKKKEVNMSNSACTHTPLSAGCGHAKKEQ